MSYISLGTPVCAQALPVPITVPAYAIEACRLLVNMCFDMMFVLQCHTLFLHSVSQPGSRPAERPRACVLARRVPDVVGNLR